jgi:hypothetical protein
LTVVGGLELCRRDVAVVVGDLTVETAMVEPVDVAHGGELDVVSFGISEERISDIWVMRNPDKLMTWAKQA